MTILNLMNNMYLKHVLAYLFIQVLNKHVILNTEFLNQKDISREYGHKRIRTTRRGGMMAKQKRYRAVPTRPLHPSLSSLCFSLSLSLSLSRFLSPSYSLSLSDMRCPLSSSLCLTYIFHPLATSRTTSKKKSE